MRSLHSLAPEDFKTCQIEISLWFTLETWTTRLQHWLMFTVQMSFEAYSQCSLFREATIETLAGHPWSNMKVLRKMCWSWFALVMHCCSLCNYACYLSSPAFTSPNPVVALWSSYHFRIGLCPISSTPNLTVLSSDHIIVPHLLPVNPSVHLSK